MKGFYKTGSPGAGHGLFRHLLLRQQTKPCRGVNLNTFLLTSTLFLDMQMTC